MGLTNSFFTHTHTHTQPERFVPARKRSIQRTALKYYQQLRSGRLQKRFSLRLMRYDFGVNDTVTYRNMWVYLGMSLLTMLLIGANLSEPYTSVLNAADCYVPAIHTYDYIPYPNSMMAKNLFYCPMCTYVITHDCAVILPCTWPGRMADWWDAKHVRWTLRRQRWDAESQEKWEARLCWWRETEVRCWDWRRTSSYALLTKRDDRQGQASLDSNWMSTFTFGICLPTAY